MHPGLLLTGAGGLLALPSVGGGSESWPWNTRVGVTAVVAGTTLVEGALVLCARPIVTDAAGAHAGEHFFPGGVVAGWVSLVLAVAIPAALIWRATVIRRQRRRARADDWVGYHVALGGVDVVLVPTEAAYALVVPGDPPQVQVSRGLVDQLSAEELVAVIEHELAHVTFHHSRHLFVSRVVRPIMGWIRPLRASLDALERSVELWADSAAFGADAEGREIAERVVAKVQRLRATQGFPVSEPRTRYVGARGLQRGHRRRPARLGLQVTLGAVLLLTGLTGLWRGL